MTDDEIPDPGPIITQLGEVWELGTRHLAGSALEEASYAAVMGEDEADLVL